MKEKSKVSLLLFLTLLASCQGSNNKKEPDFVKDEVPSQFREERSDGKVGKVVPLRYTTKDYANNSGKTEEKTLNVYVPFNYSASEKYNVLYLIHGTDKQTVNHIETWFNTIGVKVILDNLIAEDIIDPLLVVTPTFYSYGLYGDDAVKDVREATPVKTLSSANFSKELRNDIIPMVESTYSTYAEDTSEKALANSREHRAIAGLSNGARITLNAGIIDSFDYFSEFGCFSSSIDSKTLLDALHQEKYQNYSLNCFTAGAGIYDFAYHNLKKMMDEIEKDSLFHKEENTYFFDVDFGYHSSRSWRVCFYDSLLVFFGGEHEKAS